jgi:hypothetical protein
VSASSTVTVRPVWPMPTRRPARTFQTPAQRGLSLSHPEDTDHHFAVDPEKFDFSAMGCYRIVGEDRRAAIYAREVIRSSTDFDGRLRKLMRVAEANVILGVIAARAGNLEQAVTLGRTVVDPTPR